MSRTYVTTPIYYVNDVPHLGTSYTTIAADAFRRYRQLRGEVVRMLTGTDEHGLKLEREARERGTEPARFVDEMSARFRAAWPELEIEPDDFIRTTEPRHEAGAAAFWQRIKDRNPDDIYLGHYEGWYCVGCEELKTEKDLEQPGNVCPLHKRPVERVKEPSYFFRLSRFEQPLLEHYKAHPGFVQPETRLNEVISFVGGGLRDLSISRTSFNWGVPVPGDPKHVMYVWFDALTNYWTALQDTEEHKKFWSEATEIVHLVGKDILRFHAVHWPAFLMSAGLPLPTTVFAHGFLTYAGQKMSKSLRNAVDPLAIAREFGVAIDRDAGRAAVSAVSEAPALRPSPHAGAEIVRYQLLRAVSFGQDGDFDLAAMVERYNADLGKNLGNLLARTLGLCAKLTDGKVPADPVDDAFDREFVRIAEADRAWRHFEPHRALAETMALCTAANVYVDRAAPWAEAKAGNQARVGTILRTLLGALERISVMIWPVLPSKSTEMRRQLGLGPIEPSPGSDAWPLSAAAPTAGRALPGGAPLFPTIDEDGTRALLAKLAPRIEAAAPAPPPTTPSVSVAPPSSGAVAPVRAASSDPAPSIPYETFAAVDLRVGVVVSCERVPKKDKLLQLTVDVGEAQPRAIVAGLALSFQPEALVGRKVVVVANLAPREFGKGLVSHGMLLATGPSEKLVLASVDGDAAPGAKLK
jgi:methionyl-tRNA synthetase